ncbi:MAG TPA: tetratricopeptide repeat protein [Herpetosiphon sp.]|uniref:TPR repeat-containing protein n=1 Tax=Herpetosiphon aurantiacus (strain ATCC 23779 / DSM 785 / 114-95) TaxID=316274 RepID=A9B5G3_HERA2|nr:TPR repeat-containing protein [Herpetosiphon aurantiacus DSM 785]HBW49751.1 tetratricopeptide repeat protein [Herpetosiphon sp.]
MRGNSHVRFLGGGSVVIRSCYPTDHLPERSQLPPHSVMPYQPLSDFVGREAQLYQLAQAMLRSDPTLITPTALATGMGGIGKSSLALEFAHRYGSYFAGGVFWLYAATNETLQASLDRCWDSLKPDEWRYEVKPETRLRVVRELFNQPIPRLLIFDNCEDPALLTAYRPQASSGCQLLVTSRRSQWQGTNLITLDTLPPLESRQLLQQLAAQPNINNYLSDTDADQLAELVGHLPLALHLVGSSLKFYFRKPAAEYIAALQNQRIASLQAMVKPTSKLHQNTINNFWSVRDTVEVSYGLLPAELGQACRRLLLMMAYCAPNVVIPWELLQAASGYDDDSLTEYLWELTQAGFFNDPTQPRLHPLMADVIIDLDAANEPENYRSLEQALIMLSNRYHDQWAMREIEMLLPHLEYSDRQASQHPDYAGELGYQAGLCLYRQGKYVDAEHIYREVLSTQNQLFETENPIILNTKHALADVLGDQGLLQEAEQLFNEVYRLRKKVLGQYHPHTLKSKKEYATAMFLRGNYADAEQILREILTIQEQSLGKEHWDSLLTKHNLASIRSKQGYYALAERMYREILKDQEQIFGVNHPDTLATKRQIANNVGYQGRYAETERIYREVLPIYELILGLNHPYTLTTKHGIAWALNGQGLYKQAEYMYREVLLICEQTLRINHPEIITTKHNIAWILSKQQHYLEAEVIYREVLEIREQSLGTNHPDSLSTKYNLAATLYHQSCYREAELLFDQVLSIREKVLGTQHASTQATQEWLELVRSKLC